MPDVQELEARIQELLSINERHKQLNGSLREELRLAQRYHEDCWKCTCGIATNCNCKHLGRSSYKKNSLDIDTILQEVLDDD